MSPREACRRSVDVVACLRHPLGTDQLGRSHASLPPCHTRPRLGHQQSPTAAVWGQRFLVKGPLPSAVIWRSLTGWEPVPSSPNGQSPLRKSPAGLCPQAYVCLHVHLCDAWCHKLLHYFLSINLKQFANIKKSRLCSFYRHLIGSKLSMDSKK